jgi:hypothetical protein
LAHIADAKGALISRKGNAFRGFAELATWIAESGRVCLIAQQRGRRRWIKVKNPRYSQAQGREEFLHPL